MKVLRPVVLLLMVLSASFAGAAAQDPNPATLHSTRGAWPLYRQWNRAELHHFAAWISHIYDRKANGNPEQRLAKLERVLTDPEMNLLLDPAFLGEPANPQVDLASIRAMHRIVDCHKLVMSLAAYYSCRRGLPFMFSTVRSSDGTDIRTAFSTIPVGSASSFDYPSAHQVFVDATVGTCTGNLRVPVFGKNSELSDTCPVAITKEHLIPGCLYYLDGHVLVLAKIEPDGNVRFLDATTSPTRDLYTFQGLNAVTGITPKRADTPENPYAECFRGFRMLRYPIAETDASGKVIRVRRRTDAEMAEFGFSTEQYDKMEELVRTSSIKEDGLTFGSMHQFIRHRLRSPELFQPTALLHAFAARARDQMSERDALVQAAWADVNANGPIPFPDGSSERNIYNAEGRWGQYATALTDTEFRASYFNLMEDLDAVIQWYDIHYRDIDMTGLYVHAVWSISDMAWAVLLEKDRIFAETKVTFTDGAGKQHTITLADVEQRLFDLSFDPNHPPELRWGIRPDAETAASLPESPTPLRNGKALSMAESYRRGAYYRTLAEREIGETPLAGMPEGGFPVRQTMNDYLWSKWDGFPSPPLVPHGGRAAYEAQTASVRRVARK